MPQEPGRRRSSMGSTTLGVAPCRELSCGGSGRHIKTGPFLTRSAWTLCWIHLAAMTCIRPGECAVCQESMRDPFGSAHIGYVGPGHRPMCNLSPRIKCHLSRRIEPPRPQKRWLLDSERSGGQDQNTPPRAACPLTASRASIRARRPPFCRSRSPPQVPSISRTRSHLKID